MDMKYFRLIFSWTGENFVHFGEIKDTLSNEKFLFLYLSGKSKPVNQRKKASGHMLFLYPKFVDLLVLGENNRENLSKLGEIVNRTQIGTLICPEGTRLPENCMGDGVMKIVELKTDHLCKAAGPEDMQEKNASEGKAEPKDRFSVLAAGWKFEIFCAAKNALAMVHEPEEDWRNGRFGDCVMNVKAMTDSPRCACEEEPDEYGCALGCVLHRDHEACRVSLERNGQPCLNGTVLFPLGAEAGAETGAETGAEKLKKIVDCQGFGNGKFYVVSDLAWEKMKEMPWRMQGNRYFISAGEALSDASAGEISRSDARGIPVLLREEEGICCAGFLKYKDGNN